MLATFRSPSCRGTLRAQGLGVALISFMTSPSQAEPFPAWRARQGALVSPEAEAQLETKSPRHSGIAQQGLVPALGAGVIVGVEDIAHERVDRPTSRRSWIRPAKDSRAVATPRRRVATV